MPLPLEEAGQAPEDHLRKTAVKPRHMVMRKNPTASLPMRGGSGTTCTGEAIGAAV